jgi:hypothetical protein
MRTREAPDEDGESEAVAEGIHDNTLCVGIHGSRLREEDVEESSDELGGAALLHPLLL